MVKAAVHEQHHLRLATCSYRRRDFLAQVQAHRLPQIRGYGGHMSDETVYGFNAVI